MHVHLAALCASGTRLAPTAAERRPLFASGTRLAPTAAERRPLFASGNTLSADRSEAKTKYPAALLRCKFEAL